MCKLIRKIALYIQINIYVRKIIYGYVAIRDKIEISALCSIIASPFQIVNYPSDIQKLI